MTYVVFADNKEKLPEETKLKKVQIQEVNKDDVMGKRTWKPTGAHKSPFKHREIDVLDKPTNVEMKLYKWITENSSKPQ